MINCGFFISTDDLFIAASPDSLISRDCCGEGCVEVKWPCSSNSGHLWNLRFLSKMNFLS